MLNEDEIGIGKNDMVLLGHCMNPYAMRISHEILQSASEWEAKKESQDPYMPVHLKLHKYVCELCFLELPAA